MPRKFEYYDRVRRPKIENPKMTGEYISYEIKQVVKKTGDGEDDFEIEEKIIEKKTNIKEFINSWAKDVGIEGVLRKLKLTGQMDMDWLNQINTGHADLSIIPEDPEEALKLTKGVKAAFSKLDPELTQGLSPEEFISNLTKDKIDAYIDSRVRKKFPKKDSPKEDDK